MNESLWVVVRICFLLVMYNIMNVLGEDINVLIKPTNSAKVGDSNRLAYRQVFKISQKSGTMK